MGEPPAVEITITNLNDNIDKVFLTDMIQKCGASDELYIYYHPTTNKHLGLARIVFEQVKAARICMDKYNGKSVMGKILNVFRDAFGEECKRILEAATTADKKPPQPPPPPLPSQPPLPPHPPAEDPILDVHHRLFESTAVHSTYKDKEGREWDHYSSSYHSAYDVEWESDRYHDKKDGKEKKHHYHHKSDRERDRRERDRDRDSWGSKERRKDRERKSKDSKYSR